MSDSLRPCGLEEPARLLCPWNSPDKNTGVGCHPVLQGILPTRDRTPHVLCLLHWQVGFLPLVPPAAAAKSLHSCPILCDPIDSSPPGSSVPGIFQAGTLEWVAISFSSAWKWNHSVMPDSEQPHGVQPTRLLRPWDFPGKRTGLGCHCLLH